MNNLQYSTVTAFEKFLQTKRLTPQQRPDTKTVHLGAGDTSDKLKTYTVKMVKMVVGDSGGADAAQHKKKTTDLCTLC